MVHQPVHRSRHRRPWYGVKAGTLSAVALIVLVSLLQPSSFYGIAFHPSEAIAAPTRSTTIALTSDEARLVVVNREANSVSIIRVKDNNGNDVNTKLAEIAVGQEPRCVAVHPTDRAAYVTNGITGTVSVVDLVQGREVQQIQVGTEPRGCALTPDGSLLYVANHTEGTVSILVVSRGCEIMAVKSLESRNCHCGLVRSEHDSLAIFWTQGLSFGQSVPTTLDRSWQSVFNL